MKSSSEIRCRVFNTDDFSAYKSWFSDFDLNNHLGPMNKAWLNYILSDQRGEQFSFLQSDELIAVAGVSFPEVDSPYYFLTDIAVRPDLRRSGLGLQVLQQMERIPTLKKVSVWRANVFLRNQAAIKLFKRAGWKRCENSSDDEFILFEKSVQ